MLKRYCLCGLTLSVMMVWQTSYAELRDPTQPANYDPAVAAAELGKGLALTAIFDTKHQRSAIINGQVVQIGDRIAEFEVLNITNEEVRLKGPKGIFALPLSGADIKQEIK